MIIGAFLPILDVLRINFDLENVSLLRGGSENFLGGSLFLIIEAGGILGKVRVMKEVRDWDVFALSGFWLDDCFW